MWSNWWWLIPIVLLTPIIGFYILSWTGVRPTNLGVRVGKLTPCPTRPNCVCTQAEDTRHRIDPMPFRSSSADAMIKLKQAIASLPRTRLIKETADYLHVECTSLIFRFVDDLEFWIDDANHVIHARSASRVGYSDRGVNRRRLEAIRKLFVGG